MIIHADDSARSALDARKLVQDGESGDIRFARVSVFFDFNRMKCVTLLDQQVDFMLLFIAVKI